VAERPEVPTAWVRRLDRVLSAFPECHRESAWVGTRWRVGTATVAHVFGGEDGLFRIVPRRARRGAAAGADLTISKTRFH
jgi:hypothetical protein